MVWPDSITHTAIKIKSLHLVAKEEQSVRVEQEEEPRIRQNIY